MKTTQRKSISLFPRSMLQQMPKKLQMPDKEEGDYSVIIVRACPERQRSIAPGESLKVWESPDSLQLPWNDALSPHPPPPRNTISGEKNTADLLSTSLINLLLSFSPSGLDELNGIPDYIFIIFQILTPP